MQRKSKAKALNSAFFPFLSDNELKEQNYSKKLKSEKEKLLWLNGTTNSQEYIKLIQAFKKSA